MGRLPAREAVAVPWDVTASGAHGEKGAWAGVQKSYLCDCVREDMDLGTHRRSLQPYWEREQALSPSGDTV